MIAHYNLVFASSIGGVIFMFICCGGTCIGGRPGEALKNWYHKIRFLIRCLGTLMLKFAQSTI